MVMLKPVLKQTLMAVACMSALPGAHAAIALDRTRAIFNGDDASMTLNISNDNKELPYLAQAWVENDKGVKITTGPLVATPPLQRLEPGAKSMVRLSASPEAGKLPQDRESLFYFSLREIPPKSTRPNVLQIALQTKIKLFFRPAAIRVKPNAAWQEQLVLNKEAGGYRVENPTPYYVTVIGLGGNEKAAKEDKFEVVMVAPKSAQMVKAGDYSAPWLSWIDDYGGRPTMQFTCAGSRCTAMKK